MKEDGVEAAYLPGIPESSSSEIGNDLYDAADAAETNHGDIITDPTEKGVYGDEHQR